MPSRLACPFCERPVLAAPVIHSQVPGQLPRTTRDCPACGEPLVFWWRGFFAGTWQIDEAKLARRRFERAHAPSRRAA